MEIVGNFPDLASARVAQSVLEDAGLAAEIPDEYLSGIDWQMVTALHGIRLQVAPEDADVARTLLADAPEQSETAGEDVCPRCHSDKSGPPTWGKRIKALALFFLPALLLYPVLLAFSATTECYACGHRWSPVRCFTTMRAIEEAIAEFYTVPPGTDHESDRKVQIVGEVAGYLEEERVARFYRDVLESTTEFDLARIEVCRVIREYRDEARSHERILASAVALVLGNDDDCLVRQWAAIAAGTFSDTPEVFEQVRRCVLDRDEDEDVRFNCLAALRPLDLRPEVVTILQQLVDDPLLGSSASRELSQSNTDA